MSPVDGSVRSGIFDPRVVAALVAAGIVAFALFLLLLAYAGDLRAGRDGRAHALSGSAIGFKGLVRLIELGGGEARMIRTPADLATEDLVVVTVEERTDPAGLHALLARRAAKPTLLILPKWEVVEDELQRGFVREVGWHRPSAIERLLEKIGRVDIQHGSAASKTASGLDFLANYRVPAPKLVQTVFGEALRPLLVAGNGAALLARIGGSAHYVLAEPDLLNNQGLKHARSARAALVLLAELNSTGAETVSFDLTLNGFARRPNALRLAFEPPFLPLTLVLFSAAVLAGLHGAFRFGPEAGEARAIALGKSALVENSAGLFKIARREHSAGGPYAELIREAAARQSGAHLALRESELDAYLDHVSPPDGPNFSTLAGDARRARTPFELLATARALFQWKKDLTK